MSDPSWLERSDSMSSFDLRTTPSVLATASASSASRFSITSAATQSMVSETPGALYSSIVRSSCTRAVTWADSVADAAGTTLRVENTYQPRPAGLAPGTGTGLANVRQRYALLGAPAPVAVEQAAGIFTVTLPLLPA